MKSTISGWLAAAILTLAALGSLPSQAGGQTLLRDICRVKGQEENVLHGVGIVVGLKGTGDGNFLPATTALAKIMTVLGEPLGQGGLAELKDAKNVALVAVTAVVPEAGSRQGDRIDCVVSSIGSAKDLTGGRLFHTALIGPDRNNPTVFAFAEGPITIEDTTVTTGRVHAGCRLEADLMNVFTLDDKITLVLDQNHASFNVAQDVTEAINTSQLSFQSSGQLLAKAVNQANIEVAIPSQYREDPVLFVSQVLSLPALDVETGARVVINERAGSIVISGDVEIGAVVVTHRNVVIETGGVESNDRFIKLDPRETDTPKLTSLVKALNAVHLPNEDIIDIIKGLDRNGKLHAKLIIE